MKLAWCPGCERYLPARASGPRLWIVDKEYRPCSARCFRRASERYAGVLRATAAQHAAGPLLTSAFAPVTFATRPTAAGAPAAQPMSFAANPTARTGHHAPPKPPAKAGLNPISYCISNHPLAERCRVSKCPCCDGLGVAAMCTNCDGAGSIIVRSQREADLAHEPRAERCEVCRGHGYIAITEELLTQLGFRKDPQSCSETA